MAPVIRHSTCCPGGRIWNLAGLPRLQSTQPVRRAQTRLIGARPPTP